MSPQILLRSIAVLALGAGGVNLAHAVSPDAGTPGTQETPADQTAQLADAVAEPKQDALSAKGVAAGSGPAAEGQPHAAAVKGSDSAQPGAVQKNGRLPGQGGGRVPGQVAQPSEVVHADLDRRPEDRPKIHHIQEGQDTDAHGSRSKAPSDAGYVSRLAAAPSSRADILCNDLDYLKRRLARKGVDMAGIQVELHRHHDAARKARFIMARANSQATLRAFATEVSDLRAKKVRLPLVADPGELESAGLYRRCSCAGGKANCP